MYGQIKKYVQEAKKMNIIEWLSKVYTTKNGGFAHRGSLTVNGSERNSLNPV